MNFQNFTWPRLLALILLLAGILLYFRNYPGLNPPAKAGVGVEGDTLLSVLGRMPRNDSGLRKPAAVLLRNPFRTRSSHPGGGTGNYKSKSPSTIRRWKLKGTAGNSVATVLDSAGVKHLLRVGDTVGGVWVLEVNNSRVSMQDEAGRFELELEK